ncbi:4-hydroxybutyrate--acetyl-CoA CoA transferase [Clostridium bovifaecis]|uniref:4-hydroxybutyrate--acetyl-CoA CoA transferase n=1 Tax=Clostridium bovifaecis TaxID=2184719 RepID=A0A6I6ELS0_9CLOT|nr:4-hydroxybutyrate--acetyl-CoA CoA transferase [Clostridium bovifaecis]
MFQQEYKRKLIDVYEAVNKIKSNDFIITGNVAAEPLTFMENMNILKDNGVENVTLINLLPLKNFDFYSNPSYIGVLNFESMFYSKFLSPVHKAGRITFTPNHLRNCGVDKMYYLDHNKKPLNIYVLAVTPMDKHGYFTSSSYGLFNRDVLKKADMVIVEINPNAPRTFGDTQIHINEVDYIFEGKGDIIYAPSKKVNDDDRKIGKYISELVNDGDTIQLGIGGIPTASAMELKDKKDLGIHTEMLNDGLVYLCKNGVVTNRKKNYFPDKIVTTFTLGSKETYDFIDDNVGVLHLDVKKANSPYVIAQNDNMVSVNTTLQIDLMGQCASEAVGTNQISGSGGQVDTAVGAKMSKNGRSIIALHSTAMIKTGDGKEKRRISTIVPVHEAGTIITMCRADVDFVVTENGIAALRGASLRERAKSLINIAHPDFRDELTEMAKRYNYI